MIDFTNSTIERLSIHFVGNKGNGEELVLSDATIQLSNPTLRELLLRYSINEFKSEEFFSFTFSTGEITLNPLFNFSKRIFGNQESFHKVSQDIANHLFNQSLHPQIKPGELFVLLFSGISVNGQSVRAIGLFKAENRQPFVKVESDKTQFSINVDEGINIDKLDKGCLIFDVAEEDGFRLSVTDRSSKSGEARFWRDDFLNVHPVNDNFQATKIVLDIAKKYVTDALGEQPDITRAEQVDLLNRSMSYFKSNEQYDKSGFEKDVLQDNDMIQSFREFEENYRQEKGIGTIENFEISSSAVRQQARQFKSVIKLDKNFHIYIHGNRDLIEQGVDHQTGRRYYKIYFDEEH